MSYLAELERTLTLTIAEGGDCTDLLAELDALRTDPTTVTAAVTDLLTTRGLDAHVVAGVEPHIHIHTTSGAYNLYPPLDGTRWVLFAGSIERGTYLAGHRDAATTDIAAWAAAQLATA